MLRFGMGELVIILLIVLVLFGATRLPAIARALGRSLKEFKKGTKEIQDDIDEATGEDDKPK
ncbi:MAG: twin-arginine translocase TatA/TatE family subunit [Omnitrophica bacterium]|nr:twin-arginine translocase TatA/TatE family subunit [Candidatus Omnitrophota bacterium]